MTVRHVVFAGALSVAASVAVAVAAQSQPPGLNAGGRVLELQAETRVAQSDHVKTSQVGYASRSSKFAMLTATPSGDVIVRRAGDGSAAFTAAVAPARKDADSGDTIHAVDFSALVTPGEYYLDVPGIGASHPFRVGDDLFARPFRLAMRSFLGQRCGTAVSLAPDFPQYHYEACHLAPTRFHASSGKSGELDCTGGWHDAGDYGRYIVNSGITTGTLLWAYELNAAKLRTLDLDLPESGGPIPDVLAEIKWNIDWMLKMQDRADGGVWHKATSANFCGFVMPKDDTLPTLVIGSGTAPFKTTEATADFAAVCAIAARTYRPFDAAYADRCLAAAEQAWQWLAATPDHHFDNPTGISTGGYGDRDATDERLWAAAELFRTTGKPAYNDYFLAHYKKWTPTLKGDGPQGWANVQNMAMYTYALADRPESNAEAVTTIRRDAIAAADDIVRRSATNGYRIPLTGQQYFWGSNGVVANYAMMVQLAHRFAPKPEYLDAAHDMLHYLLGRNTFNTSFLTHVGRRWFMHPHHRPSGADEVDQPWPGLLSGGPNARDGRRELKDPSLPPARAWRDHQDSFTTNENAINWNAPLVFALAEVLPAAREPRDAQRERP